MADLGVEEDEEEQRLINLSARLPSHLRMREVKDEHQKPCSRCGQSEWTRGDYYVVDTDGPKYCVTCAEAALDEEYDSDVYCCEGCNEAFDLLELNDDMLCADCAKPDDKKDEHRENPDDEPPAQRRRTQ